MSYVLDGIETAMVDVSTPELPQGPRLVSVVTWLCWLGGGLLFLRKVRQPRQGGPPRNSDEEMTDALQDFRLRLDIAAERRASRSDDTQGGHDG